MSELLRVATAGSVDDGKSTLIGRLLYDTKSLFSDQLEAVERTSRNRGDEYTDLALLTDGLRAEREQGITIDVAYRSFVTPRRRFQLADAPGHVQYTRNMVTGASTADVAIILVDARKGVIEQTRRHSYITAILETPHVVYAVNKMEEWFRTAGAIEVTKTQGGAGPGLTTHAFGGTRMGDNPENNVVDRWGFSHEAPNLGILGASVIGTSGARNPTLTVQALAWRTAERLVQNWKSIGA